jgi:hypothetical protein
MVDLGAVDLDELATALGDQGYFEHRWLIDPDSGEISLWTAGLMASIPLIWTMST